MKQKFRVFRRSNGIFFVQDRLTGKQESLRTRDQREATRLLHARNEAHEQPLLNYQIARAYLAASDPAIAKRRWTDVMEAIISLKSGPTKERWRYAAQDAAFGPIRDKAVLETNADNLLGVLAAGTVSTNVYLRRIHNFALDMGWLPWPLVPKRQWPAVHHKEKRAITREEHERILAREHNSELHAFYRLCWHLGGSQSDVAGLHADAIDWSNRTIAYRRRKTATPVLFHFGEGMKEVLKERPSSGPLFPQLEQMHEKHRAKLFHRRCKLLGISGVSLHSYRYAWAERAKIAGYPERFAQEALGHNSKAVHRSYAKRAEVKLPSLEEYESRGSGG